MCVKVIGIDPAPSKNSAVFNGKKFHLIDANTLKRYLDYLKKTNDAVLICWDAPLTGPRDPDAEQILPGDYSQRKIESFFRSPVNGMGTPPGVKVKEYSGCPHWTITRGLLGLPRVGRYDTPCQDLPFKLIALEKWKRMLDASGKYVVEVHPALALWLWFANKNDYHYKKDLNILNNFYSSIKEKFKNFSLPESIRNDDELDALVAWLLGKLWIESSDVALLGNNETGAILLPNIKDLIQNWNTFNS